MLVLFISVVLLFIGVCFLSWRIKCLSDRISMFESSLDTQTDSMLGPHLKLKILDPLRLAQQESRLAKAVGTVSPSYINSKVYQQVAQELEVAMKERNIDVSIELFGLKGSSSTNN